MLSKLLNFENFLIFQKQIPRFYKFTGKRFSAGKSYPFDLIFPETFLQQHQFGTCLNLLPLLEEMRGRL